MHMRYNHYNFFSPFSFTIININTLDIFAYVYEEYIILSVLRIEVQQVGATVRICSLFIDDGECYVT